ncbi:LysR family transcriptional regulator [Cytobacillus solani]|uniref:LysR family transcriptional regulator n=1 Tax=Cytobacillus solani TaxID=1637975 RepID=A0A0Q3SIJ4_9BACI|nr:LysR family transcriptional regulator [Cytobacillus solani]KQL19436.1 LysR family transcriptional regulator [Cytobacillus solani]USK57357.1 LysR family transcriptional regulator [Cytobacillus solani]
MDIRQLRYFIAIVEEGKISAAAEKLHMSQPPLSQQLKTMEEELGTKLVERSGKYFKVTNAGKILYKYALQMTQLMEEAKIEVKEVGNGVSGPLTIGVNTFSVDRLSEILQEIQKQYPKVSYKILQNESFHLCQLVRNRTIELAFIRLPLNVDDFSILHLYTEPFYFVTSNKRKIIDEEVTLDKIKKCPLILPSTEGLGVHYLISEAFSRLTLQPHIIGECSDITLLLDLISADFGTSIVPETVLNRHRGYPIHAYKIESNAFSSPIGLIWLKNHSLSKAALNFVDLFKSDQKE